MPSSGFIRSTIDAGSKLTFKDFFVLGALSAILSRTFRVNRKRKKDLKKLKLQSVSVSVKRLSSRRKRLRIKKSLTKKS